MARRSLDWCYGDLNNEVVDLSHLLGNSWVLLDACFCPHPAKTQSLTNRNVGAAAFPTKRPVQVGTLSDVQVRFDFQRRSEKKSIAQKEQARS